MVGSDLMQHVAAIFGTGPGLGASLARRFALEGLTVAVAARDVGKLAGLVAETGARVFACDVRSREQVEAVFGQIEHELGPCEIVVFNTAQRYRGALLDLDPERIAEAVMIGAYGGFLVGQCAARAMLPRARGSIFFTGATASVKGMAQSAPFAMQKFALRGLAQSMSRELHPAGIHVAHIVIDGRIGAAGAGGSIAVSSGESLDPNAIAAAYLELHRQDKSAWSAEIELRPYTEAF
jgi:NAD(P)-dependent dehydrogenase (short-subunit alcohol dehydrogenase family)